MAIRSAFLPVACGMIASNMLACTAQAANEAPAAPSGLSAEINATQSATYDSNPLRLTHGETSLYGSTTSPELVLRKKTPTSLVESTTRVDANVYDHSEYNSVDMHEKLSLGRENQRWSATLNGNVDYDTTRTSELTNYALNLPMVRSTRISAAPQISYHINPRDALVLYSSAMTASYDNRAYTNYNFYQISPGIQHQFDPQNTGSMTLNGQRYETARGKSSSSDSIGPSIGWTTILTPRLTVTANAGAQSTQNNGANKGADSSSWNYVFAGGVTYHGTQDTLDFTAKRAREPFGNGTETLLDTFAVDGKHALNQKIELNGLAKYQSANYSTQPGINLDSGVTLGTGIAYRVVDDIALTADYKFRDESLTNLSGHVEQHIVMLGVSLHPSWSRN